MSRAEQQSSILSIAIPTSIFCDRRYAFSEALVRHLAGLELKLHEIAEMLNRNDRTIWTIYNRAKYKEKGEKRIIAVRKEMMIPTHIFKDRTLSIMEVLIEYMKDRKQLAYHEIAEMLNRNDRTIWTIHSRTKQKRKRLKTAEAIGAI